MLSRRNAENPARSQAGSSNNTAEQNKTKTAYLRYAILHTSTACQETVITVPSITTESSSIIQDPNISLNLLKNEKTQFKCQTLSLTLAIAVAA